MEKGEKNKIWLQNELVEPQECNIGILGLGNLSRASAERLLLNNFNVYGWSRNQTASQLAANNLMKYFEAGIIPKTIVRTRGY